MASVIVLIIFLISSLNALRELGGWLATDAIHPSSPPESATEHVYHNDALVQMLEPPTLPNFYER